MVYEPKFPHEVIKIFFVFLKWNTVVILAVIVSESKEYRRCWKILREYRLYQSVRIFEFLIELFAFVGSSILHVLSDSMGNKVTCQ